jgi:beta-glucanase (GH16 family)
MPRALLSTAFLLSTLFISCSKDSEDVVEGPAAPVAETLSEADRVGLVWSDEFDSGTSPNPANWTYEIGDGSAQGIPGWGNGEQQFYTNRPENIDVANGFLTITARGENYSGKNYTSARIKTQEKFSFKYGRMVVRAKLPSKSGTWPAVWLLGNSITQVGWPRCGEIDVIEQRGTDKTKIMGAVHWFDQGTNANAKYDKDVSVAGLTTEFKKYTFEWTPTVVRYFVDNTKYFEMTINESMPFNEPFFIVTNIAMGGTLGGPIPSGFSTDKLMIDYIRVYEN